MGPYAVNMMPNASLATHISLPQTIL